MLNKLGVILLFVLNLSITNIASTAWFEAENINIGNFRFPIGVQKQFIDIPGSSFVLFYSKDGQNIVTFDVETIRFKDSLFIQKPIYNPVILHHPISGWNIYYKYESKFYLLHIDLSGEFAENIVSLGAFQGKTAVSVGIPELGVAFFAADKLYRISSTDDKFFGFPYPEDWNQEFSSLKIFLSKDHNEIFIVSKNQTTSDYQAVMFSIKTEDFDLIKAELDFFKDVVDITSWTSNRGKYFILKTDSLWLFDAESENIQLHIDGLPTGMKNILEDSSGEYMYFLESSTLNILNLNNKTIENYPLFFEKGWTIDVSSAVYDYDKNWIISILYKGGVFVREFKPCVIDVDSKTVTNFSDLIINNSFEFCYIAEEQKLVASGLEDPLISILNLENHKVDKSIPFLYEATDWSVTKSEDYPTLIANNSNTDFCRLIQPYQRKILDAEVKVMNVCQFPDGKSAFIVDNDPLSVEGQRFREYIYENSTCNTINLPYEIQNLYSETSANQIIGIKSGIIQFISQGGNIRTWLPTNYEDIKYKIHLYDPINSIMWMIYNDQSKKKYIFNQISSITNEVIDVFYIDEDAIGFFLKIEADPFKRYLYIIDESVETSRKLLILDIQNKEIIKQITLQEKITFDSGKIKVIPCIIPIPEKERLFLWAHNSKWCINTNSMELLYGDVQQNPLALESQNLGIKGYWNKNREKIIIMDSSYIGFTQTGYIYEFDLESSNVQNEIEIPNIDELTDVFFTKDKEKIIFLNQKGANISTLHLLPSWGSPATIKPTTNYVQLGEGDNAKFTINIKNEYDFPQNVTAYLWLYAPNGTMLFFDGISMTTNITGIPLTLPKNLDITGDILTFTMPEGVPEGFYNFNAVLISEKGDRGPIGTWNFYIKD